MESGGDGGTMTGPGTQGKRIGRRGTLAALAAGLAAPLAVAAPPVPESLEIAGMAWPDLRAAIAAGWRTVILPTGGIEQNGPHMALDKHDRIIRWAARRIAAELGHTLVAPVVSFVPQGGWEPPEANMRFPGTLGITPAAFEAVLDGLARSLRSAGFRAICLVGDHGLSQGPQAAVARRLSAAWAREGVRVVQVGAWYRAAEAQDAWLRGQGETAASLGSHAGIADTSELMAIHPPGVDLRRLEGVDAAALGASGDPARASAARGEAILPLRVAAAVAEIRAALGAGAAPR